MLTFVEENPAGLKIKSAGKIIFYRNFQCQTRRIFIINMPVIFSRFVDILLMGIEGSPIKS